MVNKYKVAVVLVNYNGFEDTIACVKSILNTEGEKPFIILVDNNSFNNNGLIKLRENLNNVHIILSKKNVGFGKANNMGIDWALKNLQTDYIFLLNNDTEIEPDCINILLHNFPKNDDTVLISPKILTYENKPRIWYGGGLINYTRISVNIYEIGKLNKDIKSRYTEFASGCAMLFKTDYLKTKLCFDPYFFMYDEDLELSLRILKENKKIYFENDAIIFHKCQGSQKVNTTKEINQLHPNNPNLEFYLSLTIPNRFYIINSHFKHFYRIWRKMTLTAYWLGKSVQYLLFRNFKMSALTIRLIIKNL
jgi:GT2 family glycosyltransferase